MDIWSLGGSCVIELQEQMMVIVIFFEGVIRSCEHGNSEG
jgi:hypothetical protein